MKPQCPFCDQLHPQILFQNSTVRAMYPMSPASLYHVLIMPKRHVKHLDGLTANEWAGVGAALSRTVSVVGQSVKGYIGYNILSNNGDQRVNQRVLHAHIHVFLRFEQEPNNPLQVRHKSKPQALSPIELQQLIALKKLFGTSSYTALAKQNQ